MRPLILDIDVKQRLADLASYADRNHHTIDDLLDIRAGRQLPPGDQDEFICFIPVGYKVVFTIEEQQKLIRHLSMSIDRPGLLPNIEAVKEVMKLLGFVGELDCCLAKIELLPNNFQAINVWEAI